VAAKLDCLMEIAKKAAASNLKDGVLADRTHAFGRLNPPLVD
jgi:hypothetical protein